MCLTVVVTDKHKGNVSLQKLNLNNNILYIEKDYRWKMMN